MIVIKVGGGKGIHYESVCDEVAALHRAGRQPILVHGGSHLTNELATALGHPPKFVTSPSGFTSRLTDQRTLEIFLMAYCGHSNKTIVQGLLKRGVTAVGLSGIDARIWEGRQKSAIQIVENGRKRMLRGNLTGKVERVNTEFLKLLLDHQLLPVLCPPAVTREGQAINVDGDRAAVMTAIAMQADELIILSNVPGVMKDVQDESSRINVIRRDQLDEVASTWATGRMKIKLLAAADAIDSGMGRVIISDARPQQCIARALSGEGTTITASTV